MFLYDWVLTVNYCYNILIFLAVTAMILTPLPAGSAHAGPAQDQLADTSQRVIIDPGHGGDDKGVIGPAGLSESRLTLALARQLKVLLEEEGDTKVFLTRDGDENPSLSERTALVNRVRGHVFISLHAGGMPQQARSGFGVYFQDYSLQPGLTERLSTNYPGEDQPIEWALAQGPYILSSRRMAGEINQALSDALRIRSQGVVGLPLPVLAGAARPAVLVEVGYLTNPEEERRLLSQSYRDAVVAALIKGLRSYQAWVRTRLQE